MRSFAAIALLAGSCASDVRKPWTGMHRPIIFAGAAPTLQKAELAAKGCGFRRIKIAPPEGDCASCDELFRSHHIYISRMGSGSEDCLFRWWRGQPDPNISIVVK
jgi:hypothetical protein